MPLTPNFDFVYPGKYSMDELYHPSIQTPEITQLFTIKNGIKSGMHVPVVGVLSKIVKAYASCGDNPAGEAEITNCKIETHEMKVHFQQCKDDFEAHFLEDWLDDGLAGRELSAKLRGIINSLVLDAMRRDNFRILSFGDLTSLSTDYNQMDGLWTWIIANTTDYCVPRINTLGTGALAGGTALTVLRDLYNGAAIVLKQLPNNQKGFYVTGSLYENLLASYESNTTGSENQFALLQKGPSGNLMFRGIPVYPYYAWDNDLADPANPLYGTVEHLALYTTPAAHIAGMARQADMGAVRGYFWEENETYNLKAQYKMGYVSCLCELAAASW
jgi:hypothetical protein